MPTYFPQIGSSPQLVVSQLPYQKYLCFGSYFVEAGRPYSFPTRGSGLTHYPASWLGNFSVNYPSIPDTDRNALSAFFDSMTGRYGSFIFLDPGGNLINNSEVLSATGWNLTGAIISATGVADPFGGTRATQLEAQSLLNGQMYQLFLPSGGASGMTFCFSMYVKNEPPGGVGSVLKVQIGFMDNTGAILASELVPVTSSWTRVYFAINLATAAPVRAFWGGTADWSNLGLLDVFGPQVVPMWGPGAYKRSPEDYGYHPNCRFDTDIFSFKALGPNQSSVSLPVAEFNT